MLLQEFINKNTDYTSQFRNLNLNYKKYGELGYRAAIFDDGYIRHIGWKNSTKNERSKI